MQLTEDEIRRFLEQIERGEVLLTPIVEPQDVYAGVVEYGASNGWKLAVFNDCNDWDYLEWITAEDGRTVAFDELDQVEWIRNYTPSEEVAWDRYRLPGAMRFRCTACGKLLKKGEGKGLRCDGCAPPSEDLGR
jgi:hypothetical protein